MTKLIEWIDRNGCRKVTFDMPNYDYTTDLEGNIIITKYTGNEKNISIPDTFAEHKIVAIGSKAFFNLQNINSIIISDNIKNIGYRAFEGCSSLTSVNIPNSVISIGDKAFYKCFSLNSITLSNNITNIGYEMFGLCINLKSINICNNIINIGDGAFFGCSSLETISIPYNVIKIGNYAFEECDNLKFITILNNSADIGEGTFSNCGKLIVCCNENSYAWRYCEENNIPHKPMEEKSNDC